MEGVQIRLAKGAELAACQVLLQADRVPKSRLVRYLAAVQAPRQLVGAASFLPLGEKLAGVRIRVAKPNRGQGIGSRLLAALEQEARQRNCRRIAGLVSVGPGEASPFPFVERFGFQRVEPATFVEGRLAEVAVYFRSLVERLRASGRVPAGMLVKPLSEAPLAAVAALVSTEIHHLDEAHAGLAEMLEHERYHDCPVVMVAGGAVAGVLIWEVKENVATIPMRAVAPRWQRSCVNALLLEHATNQGFDRAIELVRFAVPEGNHDTRKLAARYHAKVVAVQERFIKDLI